MIRIIVLLALILRLISLNQSLWLDEATSALVARDYSWNLIFGQFLPGDFHPPLYYMLLKIWGLFFGTSEIALRSLSVVAGVATVYLVYKIVNATTAALLLATSGLHIYFSQEVRMYQLASFFVALAVYFFVKSKNEGGVGYGVALAAAVLTHYLTVLMLPVFWLIARKNKKFYMSHNIMFLAGLLWLPTFIKQLTGGLGVKNISPAWWNILGKTSLKEIALVPTKFMLGRISFESDWLYGVVVAGLGILFFWLLFRARRANKLFWYWLIVPAGLAALIGFFVPVFNYFRILFVLPAFYILVAAGISTLKSKWRSVVLGLVLTVNVVTSGIYLVNPKFHREDWRGAVNFVESQKDEGDITLFVQDSQMEAYRYYAPGAKLAGGPDTLKGEFDTIWLMRYVQPLFDPSDTVRQKIESLGYEKQGEYDFNGVVVWRYE
ncbi:hypothetical protein A2975_02655 [Candidatus Woesebacteria bacterium RIFCSPLOWO2_01_FULL_44_14]|uniref:Glycosyltransferase RgtA/B/C/D-like domain-containing protein n=1 Tax=Candidatus Woesebacteria bacterium RIFCSPLOWO2_01_FULL_44_14 TaxID=1802525 RepID=A0A1F8C388_9BACT|nr:MAG: hypothetical protein A2975_02655 [Candidatus Woesebacteria bacterium RIFCSPLOWO2_01_FULL_44_14]